MRVTTNTFGVGRSSRRQVAGWGRIGRRPAPAPAMLAGAVLIVTVMAAHGAMVAPGEVDETYQPEIPAVTGSRGIVGVQEGGRLVVTFRERGTDGTYSSRIVRLNRDGSLDPTFGIGSELRQEVEEKSHKFTLLPDDKLVLALRSAGGDAWSLHRLEPDGGLDTRFNPIELTADPDGSPRVFPLSEGRLLVAPVDRRTAVRLNADGTLDPTFEATFPGPAPNERRFLAVQADDRVLYFDQSGAPDYVMTLRRLNADGTPDESFMPEPIPEPIHPDYARVTLQPDQKIIFLGIGTPWLGLPSPALIFRLYPDGRRDDEFHIGYRGSAWYGTSSIASQPDGKLLIRGYVGSGDFGDYAAVWRLLPDGSIDHGFKTYRGYWSAGGAGGISSLAFRSDEGIFAVPRAGDQFVAEKLVRLQGGDFALWEPTQFSDIGFDETNGDVQLSLVGPPGQPVRVDRSEDLKNWEPAATTTLTDGPAELTDPLDSGVSGSFYRAVEEPLTEISTKFGEPDFSFNLQSPWNYPVDVGALAVQPDGAILIAASALWGPVADSFHSLRRALPDGQVDEGFAAPEWSGDWLHLVVCQPDGRILVSEGPGGRVIARFEQDGTLDEEYDPDINLEYWDWPYSSGGSIALMLPLGDGRVVVLGGFASGQGGYGIARFLPDGSRDPGFHLDDNFVSGIGRVGWVDQGQVVTDAALFGDGLAIVGWLDELDGQPCSGIAVLNEDGSLDGTFTTPQFGTGTSFEEVDVVGDKIIALGPVSSSEPSVRRIVRLNRDGSLDESFKPFQRSSSYWLHQLVLPDGRLVVWAENRSGPRVPPWVFLLGVDGELQASFQAWLDPWPRFMVAAPQGGLLVAGSYTVFPDLPRAYMLRLHAD